MWGQLPPLRLLYISSTLSHFCGLEEDLISQGNQSDINLFETSAIRSKTKLQTWRNGGDDDEEEASMSWTTWTHSSDPLDIYFEKKKHLIEKVNHSKRKYCIISHTISYSFTVNLSASGRTSPWFTGASNINTPNNLPPRHYTTKTYSDMPLTVHEKSMAESLHIVLNRPFTNLPCGIGKPSILTFR